MFEFTNDENSLDQVTRYEMVLGHCFEKLGVTDNHWRHSDAFTAAIDYARKSGYLNAKNELTVLGNNFASIKQFELNEAA